MNEFSGKCPVCSNHMQITEWNCDYCGTKISGSFQQNVFSRLDDNELKFVHIFLRSKGNIKEVENVLGVSYPTVKKNLDAILQKLYNDPKDYKNEKDVLKALAEGRIGAQEAAEIIGGLNERNSK